MWWKLEASYRPTEQYQPNHTSVELFSSTVSFPLLSLSLQRGEFAQKPSKLVSAKHPLDQPIVLFFIVNIKQIDLISRSAVYQDENKQGRDRGAQRSWLQAEKFMFAAHLHAGLIWHM